jgi:putative membrane protein
MFCRGFLGHGYGYFDGYGGGTGGFIMMGIGFLIFLIIISVLIFLAVRLIKAVTSSYNPPSANKALDILNERYAKGEIDEEEYLKKKNILNQKN